MEFIEALNSIYSRDDGKTIISNAFNTYAHLLDLVTSYEGNKLAQIYFKLNKQINVIDLINRVGVDHALNTLVPYYNFIKDEVNPKEFKLCVRGIVSIIEPDYFKNKPLKSESKHNAIINRQVRTPNLNNNLSNQNNNQNFNKVTPKAPKVNNNQLLTPCKVSPNLIKVQCNTSRNSIYPLRGIHNIVVVTDDISVEFINKSLNIGNSRSMEIQNLNYNVGVAYSTDVVKDTLYIKPFYTNKNYKFPIIDSNCITIYGDFKNIKSISIETKGKVNFIGNTNNLRIKSENQIEINGTFERVQAITKGNGRIKFDGHTVNLTFRSEDGELEINGDTSSGNLVSDNGKISYNGDALSILVASFNKNKKIKLNCTNYVKSYSTDTDGRDVIYYKKG